MPIIAGGQIEDGESEGPVVEHIGELVSGGRRDDLLCLGAGQLEGPVTAGREIDEVQCALNVLERGGEHRDGERTAGRPRQRHRRAIERSISSARSSSQLA
jgi:hypothetical protein